MKRHELLMRWVHGLSWLLLIAGVVLLARALPVQAAVDRLEIWLQAWGTSAFVVFAVVYVVATVLMAPAWPFTVAAGAIFGFGWGVLLASVSATVASGVAFLIARHFVRDRLEQWTRDSRLFAALDQAVREGGWRIVALVRLTPAPYNVMNYLFGLTPVRLGPYLIASWLAMLPATCVHVYVGRLGRLAAAGEDGAASDASAGVWTWGLRGAGVLAVVAVLVYLTRLAQNKLREQTGDDPGMGDPVKEKMMSPRITFAFATVSVLFFTVSVYARLHAHETGRWVTGLFGPPLVAAEEAFEENASGPTFDHATWDGVLRAVVTDDGMVDYEALRREHAAELEAYLEQLAGLSEGVYEAMGRDEKLALLINAYNAFTLQLILDHWPIASILDIPEDERWKADRWKVGGLTLSLDELEHAWLREKFIEPRMHFAINCASVGCPPLRGEAYAADRLDAQLDDQMRITHGGNTRWVRYDAETNVVGLTHLYDWFAGDFAQVAGSPLTFAGRYHEGLGAALKAGQEPRVAWLEWDWSLNVPGEE